MTQGSALQYPFPGRQSSLALAEKKLHFRIEDQNQTATIMKRLQFKTLLFVINFSVLISIHCYSQDLLDGVSSNSRLVIELKDVFRAFHINHILADQTEMINVLVNEGSDSELKSLLMEYIKVSNNLEAIQFKNDTLNSYVSSYVTLTIESYKIAKDKGFKSTEFKNNFQKYKEEKRKYMDYLYSTYSTNHFVRMSEEKYWQINDKKNYIMASDYHIYESLKPKHLQEALTLLETFSKQTNNFQEYSIYQIERADLYVKYQDSLQDNSEEKAIGIYKAILDQNKYSIYLFESWLKWRVVTQQNNGLSKTSDIPNNEYDVIIRIDYFSNREMGIPLYLV
jgi:hypothetical protein